MRHFLLVPALLSLSAIAAFASAPRITDAGETKYVAQRADDSPRKKSSTSLSVENWRMAPPPPWDASAAELEKKGDELRLMKAPADALDYYRAALEKTPKQDRSALYNKCGISELQLSRFDESRKNFVNAIKRNQHNAEAINNLGVAYFFRKQYGKAIKTYQKAIEIGPDSASFHSNLGRAFFASKKYDNASIEYSRALTIDPDIFSRESPGGIMARMPQEKGLYSYVLAKLLAAHGKTEESLVYLRRALDEGYIGVDKVYSEPEFAKLIKDHRFIELMNARNNPGAMPPR
ncbi:MAG: tetratricopeptide repeat protein [Acidobacteriota bacterium]|nr:tetratricopeptide repeat protein [Acidobacteriota bacterium]